LSGNDPKAVATNPPPTRALDDIERLLRHKARQMVEALQEKRAPVNPRAIAERLAYDHNHHELVRTHRDQLVHAITDYVRELRAAVERSP
jgi:hypothetical protein